MADGEHQCDATNATGTEKKYRKGERCTEAAVIFDEGLRFCWLHYSVIRLGLGSAREVVTGRRRKAAEL